MSDHKLKEQIKKLNQIGIALTSETHLPTLLELIVREVRGFTRADAGSLYSVDRNQIRFEVAQNDTLAARKNEVYNLCKASSAGNDIDFSALE